MLKIMLIIIGLLFRNKAVQNNFPDSTDKFSPGNSVAHDSQHLYLASFPWEDWLDCLLVFVFLPDQIE